MDNPSSSTSEEITSSSQKVDSKLWFSFRNQRPTSPNFSPNLPSSSLPKIPSLTSDPLPLPNRTLLYYPLRRAGARGRALIFNYKHFSSGNKSTREGSEEDVRKLTSTFTKLGFTVQSPYLDYSASQTYHQLQTESRQDHKDLDALIICILSHGERGDLICTSEGASIAVEQITALFTPDRCPSLAGKPKLFFIQACRGTKLDPGVLVSDSPTKSLSFLLPTQADFFLFFSTVAGHYAWRNTDTGSWFISDLCYVLDSFAGTPEVEDSSLPTFDLATLATLVCQRVAFTRESFSPGDARMDAKKQTPVVVSTLTRLLKFDPWRS